MLFTWDSGFGNDQLGVTEDVLGDNGTISTRRRASATRRRR